MQGKTKLLMQSCTALSCTRHWNNNYHKHRRCSLSHICPNKVHIVAYELYITLDGVRGVALRGSPRSANKKKLRRTMRSSASGGVQSKNAVRRDCSAWCLPALCKHCERHYAQRKRSLLSFSATWVDFYLSGSFLNANGQFLNGSCHDQTRSLTMRNLTPQRWEISPGCWFSMLALTNLMLTIANKEKNSAPRNSASSP